jgi:hypothetical protein
VRRWSEGALSQRGEGVAVVGGADVGVEDRGLGVDEVQGAAWEVNGMGGGHNLWTFMDNMG